MASSVFKMVLLASLASPVAANSSLQDLTSVQFVGNVRADAQLQAARSLGARNVRLAVRWYEVEKADGTYSWALSDSRIFPILRSGLRPVITIFGSNARYLPSGPGVRNDLGSNAAALAAFSRFSADVVVHYGTQTMDGRPIPYEIWNEPNTRTFWGSQPNPEDYATLATSACRAIKALRPQALVIGLAMEGTPVKAPYFVPAYNIDIYRQWAGRAFTPALAACVDGISMHPYRAVPETYLNDEKALSAFLASGWAKKATPIVINSEWGSASGHKPDGTGDRDQAILDIRTLLIGAGSLRLTNIYQIMDAGANIGDANNSFGLFQYHGAIKMAGQAISNLLAKIGSYDVDGVGEMPGHKGVYVFRCHKGDGAARRRAVVIWTIGKDMPTKLPLGDIATPALGVSLIDGLSTSIDDPAVSVSTVPFLVMER